MTIQQIKDLFTLGFEDRQRQAIEEAIALAKNDTSIGDLFRNIRMQYNTYIISINTGILVGNAANTQLAQITKQFLSALGQLENLQNDKKEQTSPNQNTTYNITINNEGGKIGQINNGGNVDNKDANFNL